MNHYAVYVRFDGKEEFLQVARNIEDLKGPKTKLLRWAAEMGLELQPKSAVVVIKQDGEDLLHARLGLPRLLWKSSQTS